MNPPEEWISKPNPRSSFHYSLELPGCVRCKYYVMLVLLACCFSWRSQIAGGRVQDHVICWWRDAFDSRSIKGDMSATVPVRNIDDNQREVTKLSHRPLGISTALAFSLEISHKNGDGNLLACFPSLLTLLLILSPS